LPTNGGMRLDGKAVALTGASTGIGRAIALRLAEAGARLLLGDVQIPEGEALTAEIRDRGGEAAFIRTDVGQRADNDRLVSDCIGRYGRIDVLICNAGITLPKLLTDSTDDEIDRLLDVNLLGPILFTASKTGLVAQRDSPVYCASKGGVVLLARALALDYADRGIRVNALCPGIIDTPMLRHFADSMPDPDAAWAEYSAAQPMGRLGTSEECADAALYLVSDASSFLTGVALPVDGGFTAM
jgi:NAD(P)-dependent dehydrogenase (short-subunit alcohol dehydrogenase family)